MSSGFPKDGLPGRGRTLQDRHHAVGSPRVPLLQRWDFLEATIRNGPRNESRERTIIQQDCVRPGPRDYL
jgi:hypothetical protein